MAQHYRIETFEQKAIQRIAASIRKEDSFSGSLKYEELRDREYQETYDDRVFTRSIPKSILPYNPVVEIHTRPMGGSPYNRHRRVATNIYVVA